MIRKWEKLERKMQRTQNQIDRAEAKIEEYEI
jgi:hypothetical protein